MIPTLTIIVLFFTHFNTANFTSHGFAPYGTKGVLEAVSAGGAIFSLLGFEQAVQLGGESRNPQRDLPRAVIGSILIGATIYMLLQVVFIGALPASALRHGWADVNFTGIFGPFAGIAKGLGLGWLAYILYADAIIAPVGTGLVYTTTSSRLTFGLSKNGNVPAIFEKTNRTGVPWFGLVFAFLWACILFLPFPGWQTLVGFITSATVLMYAGAPLALGALRRQKPELPRPVPSPGRRLLGARRLHRRQPDHLLERLGGRSGSSTWPSSSATCSWGSPGSPTPTRPKRRWTGRRPSGSGPTSPASP